MAKQDKERKHEKTGTVLVFKEHPTVGEQLAYFGALGSGENKWPNLWTVVVSFADTWKSPLCELDVDLTKVNDPKITNLIIWACNELAVFMTALEQNSIDPNSSAPQ